MHVYIYIYNCANRKILTQSSKKNKFVCMLFLSVWLFLYTNTEVCVFTYIFMYMCLYLYI